jgi:ankyrin repeat protein
MAKQSIVRAIHEAVNAGDAERLASAIDGVPRAELKKAINTADRDGYKPLHNALLKGHRHLLDLLIKAGAKATNKRDTIDSAMYFASTEGSPETMQALLALIPLAEWSKDEINEARNNAAEQNSVAVLEMLPKPRKRDVVAIAEHAAMYGHAQVLTWCLVKGLDPNTSVEDSEYGKSTLLHLSCRKPAATAALIDAGADVNARDWRGRTPLMCAACREAQALSFQVDAQENLAVAHEQGRVMLEVAPADPPAADRPDTVVGLLLAAGADATIKDAEGMDALAILTNEYARFVPFDAEADADALATLGAEVMAITRRERFHELHKQNYPDELAEACFAMRDQAVARAAAVFAAALRGAGAQGQSDADRAVVEAVKRGDAAALGRALSAGGSPLSPIRVQNGYASASPLGYAASAGQVECCRVLLDAGVDPDEGLSAGTPLFGAVRCGSGEIARLLLEHGADLNKTEDDDPDDTMTALEMAKMNKKKDVVAVLEAKGAKRPAKYEPFKPSGEMTDTHTEVLVKADADAVAKALASHMGGTAHLDAHDQTLDAGQTRGYIVVQLDGSAWTSVIGHVGCYEIPDEPWHALCADLSRLGVVAMVCFEGCSCQHAYWVYDAGKEIEAYEEAIDDPDFGGPGTFTSERGRPKPRDMYRGDLVINKLAKDERFCVFYSNPGGEPREPFELSFIGDRRKLKSVAYVCD